VAYVTRHTLQQRYPASGFTATYSSIELPDAHFQLATKLRQPHRSSSDPLRLIFVGSLAQRYKGLHLLLQALHLCREQGVVFSLAVLGDGAYRVVYEETAVALGLAEQVVFHGFVPQGTAVVEHLCRADLFVMPSLMEGLPRALIEAMACGLPAVGSAIGGIPELLPPEALVPANDAPALAQKLLMLHRNRTQLVAMGAVNQAVAQEYRAEWLQQRRQQFYNQFLRKIHPNLRLS
jgi:glycosyltransferase involved in cell wall biosynthesis